MGTQLSYADRAPTPVNLMKDIFIYIDKLTTAMQTFPWIRHKFILTMIDPIVVLKLMLSNVKY